MNILFVNPGRAVGGAEESLLLLVQGLRARGLQAQVALFGDGSFGDWLAGLGVPSICLKPPRSLERAGRYRPLGPFKSATVVAAGLPVATRLALMAWRERADLIHTNGMKAHLLGGLAGRLARVPVIWHLRDFPPGGWAGGAFRWAAGRLPGLVLAVSDAVACSLSGAHRDRGRVMRVYDPVDTGRFQGTAPNHSKRREFGARPGTSLVGQIAHLTPWKGHELFLTIARAVLDAGVDARFVVAGGSIYATQGHGGYAEKLTQRIRELGLGDRVAFLGARSDVPEILNSLDVLVHCPTAPEPFGRVVAEAQAAGRAVVAARCGGIPEIVEDGVTGLLVERGDAGAFSSAVVRLLGDRPLRERLGDTGRQQAVDRFGVDRHVTAVLAAYQTVLGPAWRAAPAAVRA